MTDPCDEKLIELVAELMGWKAHRSIFSDYIDAAGNLRMSPHYPAEVFRLCAKFNVWPMSLSADDGHGIAVMSEDYDLALNIVPHDNTPESRQQAATRAVLMAVEMILKEKQA